MATRDYVQEERRGRRGRRHPTLEKTKRIKAKNF